MSDKKKFKETNFGKFVNKVVGAVVDNGGDIVELVGNIATGNIVGSVGKIGDILKGEAEKNEKARELLIEWEREKMNFEKELYELEIKDRQSARVREVEIAKTGRTDWMMIVVGMTGLVSFLVVIYAVIWIPSVKDNDLFIHLLGMIEGVVISNLFAYYFGTSKSSKDKDEKYGKV